MTERRLTEMPLMVADMVETPPSKRTGARGVVDLDQSDCVEGADYFIIHHGSKTFKITWETLMACFNSDFYLEVAKGNVPGHSLVQKFGANQVPNGTFEAITSTGIYPTPTTAQALEFVSDSAQDGVGGSGAIEVTICGVNASWERITQTVITDGLTPAPLDTDLIRLCRWWVSSSGSYASTGVASQAGNLSLRLQGSPATLWDTISLSPVGESQSTIGAYTIAAGETGYLLSKSMSVDSNKSADIYFFQRQNADDVIAPYSGARRVIEKDLGISGTFTSKPKSPKFPFVGPCDIGFMGKGNAAVADISVEFELLIIQDGY